MCGLHTAGPVIRSVLQVKCIWRQSEKYEINKRKLSDVAGYGGLAVSPEPQGKSNTLHCLCPFFFFFLIRATHGPVKTEHNPDLNTCMIVKIC